MLCVWLGYLSLPHPSSFLLFIPFWLLLVLVPPIRMMVMYWLRSFSDFYIYMASASTAVAVVMLPLSWLCVCVCVSVWYMNDIKLCMFAKELKWKKVFPFVVPFLLFVFFSRCIPVRWFGSGVEGSLKTFCVCLAEHWQKKERKKEKEGKTFSRIKKKFNKKNNFHFS